jgi:hypothetical protein
MNSTRFPYMLMMSFSHEAQESPAKGFLVNMASSSFCCPPLDIVQVSNLTLHILVFLLVLSLVSEFLGDGLDQLVDLVQESSLEILKLIAVSLLFQFVKNLSDLLSDIVLKSVKIVLKHGEESCNTLKLVIVIGNGSVVLGSTRSQFLKHLL